MLLSDCRPFQRYFVVTCPECKKLGKLFSTIYRMAKREFAKHISIGAIKCGTEKFYEPEDIERTITSLNADENRAVNEAVRQPECDQVHFKALVEYARSHTDGATFVSCVYPRFSFKPLENQPIVKECRMRTRFKSKAECLA